MLIKVLGSLALAISGGGIAIAVSSFQKKKLKTLDGFISLIFFIKGQIDCYARPIGEILEIIPHSIAYSCNCQGGALCLEDMIEESAIYLDEESLRLLQSFESEFGSLFREEQMRRCDRYIEALSERRGELAISTVAKSRSGSTVALCISLCLMILLW